jgi:hypothetical protein
MTAINRIVRTGIQEKPDILKLLASGFFKILTFAPIFIKGSFTFYAKQKVSSDKSNASDIRFSAGGS